MVTVMCASCEEKIDGDTLIVISEREYGDRTDSKSLYTITYESLNFNNGLTIYIRKSLCVISDHLKLHVLVRFNSKLRFVC